MYPKELMSGIYWGFYGGKYKTLEEFINAVNEYNDEFDVQWNSNEVVLTHSHVRIQYSYWDYDFEDEIEVVFDLAADNAVSFTAGELLFKVHNKVVDNLEIGPHHFFEGFFLGKQSYCKKNNKPYYFISQGR